MLIYYDYLTACVGVGVRVEFVGGTAKARRVKNQ